MRKILECLILLSLFGRSVLYSPNRCNYVPDILSNGKSPADGRFVVRLDGNIEKYVSGEEYTILLSGILSRDKVQHKFGGFAIAVEPENYDEMGSEFANVGLLKVIDPGISKYSDKCSNAIVHTTLTMKSDVKVQWIAPPTGSGCIVIRATVIEHRDIWYKDDGPLSKILCEDEEVNADFQPLIIEPCCACDEAKYDFTFEGLWSRNTHPKDFPANNWLTKFSDIIGASHSIEYRFWEYGQLASEGLQELAEQGSTKVLEAELKSQSEFIRTIIKARGISYPNINGKMFAVFRVDPKNHLMSFVTMITPSPDWILGVASLDLCLPNCTWIENKVINLYPFDAGTDSGPSYTSSNNPTQPKDVVRRIKNPADPNSPFYDPSGTEMKPLAKLYLTRQRLYERKCTSAQVHSKDVACKTTKWSEFSECNVPCGNGFKIRERQYKNQTLADERQCKVPLIEKRTCMGSDGECEKENEEEKIPSQDPDCELTEWSEWSECNAECGEGHRTRTRTLVEGTKSRKRCLQRLGPETFQMTEICKSFKKCGGAIVRSQITLDERVASRRCKITPWSGWSPCSVTCGKGTRVRSRQILSRTPTAKCKTMPMKEEVVCNIIDCDKKSRESICRLPLDSGFCRQMTTNRWYYNHTSNDCGLFTFTMCGGNKNNFLTRTDCLRSCKKGSKK